MVTPVFWNRASVAGRCLSFTTRQVLVRVGKVTECCFSCLLSSYACERIVQLWQQGKTPALIVKDLAEEDIWTRCIVTRWIFSWTKGTGLEDQRRSERHLVITENIADYSDRMLEGDRELSTVKLHCLVAKRFGKQIPAQTIR